jgi:cytidine deaminase
VPDIGDSGALTGFGKRKQSSRDACAPRFDAVDRTQLDAAVIACRSLITTRFPDSFEHGAAAMVLGDGGIVTGTSPRGTTTLSPCATRRSHTPRPSGLPSPSRHRSVCIGMRGRAWSCSAHAGCFVNGCRYMGPGSWLRFRQSMTPTEIVWKQLHELLPDAWIQRSLGPTGLGPRQVSHSHS